MISLSQIKFLSVKQQTSELNIIREYLQHLFLSFFYEEKGSENFLFKGGTALRIIYQSPRFSEDLDFSGLRNGRILEKINENVLLKINQLNIKTELIESKPTSGGWFNSFRFHLYDLNTSIKSEVSFRKKVEEKEVIIINSDLILPYKIFILSPSLLIKEKIEALINRRKNRDLFDFYFILRTPALRKFVDFKKKNQLVNVIKSMDAYSIKTELKPFLPINFQNVLDDLKEKVIDEM